MGVLGSASIGRIELRKARCALVRQSGDKLALIVCIQKVLDLVLSISREEESSLVKP